MTWLSSLCFWQLPGPAPTPRNSLSSLINTHRQARGVCAEGDQPSRLQGRNNWYDTDEDKKRGHHQILPQARLNASEEEFAASQTWKKAFLKKAACFDSILGVVGVRFRVLRHWICQDWEDASAKKPQQISVGNRLLFQIWWKIPKESTLKWYHHICCQ